MDTTTKKIVKMLADERVERQCAAAMVLGELRAKEAEVVEALGRCLAGDNQLLQAYALEALAGVRSSKIAEHAIPLLDHPNDEIRAQASALLANQGSRAAAKLAKELQSAPPSRKRAIINIICRGHDKQTFTRLIELLPDPDVGEHTLTTLRREIDHMTPAATQELKRLVQARLKDKACLADGPGTARSLKLMGYVGDPKQVKTIMGFAAAREPVTVRLAALAALRRPLAAARSTDEAARVLLGHADDPDPTLARAALDTLKGLKLPGDADDLLIKLSSGQHAATRSFALEALRHTGGKKVVNSMIHHLGTDDPAAREAATRSLARMDEAAGPLLKALQTAEEPDMVQRLCRLLRRHADKLKPAARKAVADLTIDALERDDPASKSLLDLLAAAEPEKYAGVLVARAQIHRKAKRHEQAFALLCRLDASGLLDEEGRYAAIVSGLCSLPSKKELGRATRTMDPVLRQIVALIASGFPVTTRLKKERSLDAEDFFFVGFNFCESKDEDEKEFGGALLSHLVSKSPRSKLGKSARNKLRLTGVA